MHRDPLEPGTIAVEGLSKSFGGRWAVHGVSFVVPRGTALGLVGANGAGKSTTLKMVCGLLRPTEGEIRVGGVDVVRDPRGAKRLLGIAPQEDCLDPDLSVFENLLFHARYSGFSAAVSRRKALAALEVAELADRGGDRVDRLSSGMRRRLALSRALLAQPAILVVDEPTRGLDQESRDAFLERLRALKASGTTLLLATHDADEVDLCEASATLEEGRLVRLEPIRRTARRREPVAFSRKGAAS